jgi:hypothetical protein
MKRIVLPVFLPQRSFCLGATTLSTNVFRVQQPRECSWLEFGFQICPVLLPFVCNLRGPQNYSLTSLFSSTQMLQTVIELLLLQQTSILFTRLKSNFLVCLLPIQALCLCSEYIFEFKLCALYHLICYENLIKMHAEYRHLKSLSATWKQTHFRLPRRPLPTSQLLSSHLHQHTPKHLSVYLC